MNKRKRIFVIFLSMILLFLCAFYASADNITEEKCSICNSASGFVAGYEYINESYHSVRNWCIECGNDQFGGCNIRRHTSEDDCVCGMQRLPSPQGLTVRVFEPGNGIPNALVVMFDAVPDADSYTVVVYGDSIYEPYHFIEVTDTCIWISDNVYSWFDPNDTYRIRVQAVSGFQASLFSEPVVVGD